MSVFASLPDSAKRAAFAHMSGPGKPKVGSKKLGSGARHKQLSQKKKKADALAKTSPVMVSKPGGGFEQKGSISREEAAIKMFGAAEAQRRIAKYKARKR